MKCFIVICTYLLTLSAYAHPSWGIAADSKGNIYFVDVLHDGGTLWKFNPVTQKLTPLLSGHFHAHGLQITKDDILYISTQIWIDGEIMGDGHNYFFRFDTRDNHLDTLLFSEQYERFFGGDAQYDEDCKRIYFINDNELRYHDLNSGVSQSTGAPKFKRKCTMVMDLNSQLWISDSEADQGSIYSWSQDKGLKQYAKNLIDQTPENPLFDEKRFHLFYGLSFTQEGNLLYCESASRQVVMIKPTGEKKLIYQSPSHFSPTGITHSNGKYYITETGFISGQGHIGPYMIIISDGVAKRIKLEY